MSDLVEFLMARIAEDEAVAREAHTPGWEWSYDGGWDIGKPHYAICEAMEAGPEVLPHIARWDPERVLAECEAKRRLVKEFCSGPMARFPSRTEPSPWARHMLGLLALPYADHEDFDPRWAER